MWWMAVLVVAMLGCETNAAPADAPSQAECEQLQEAPIGSACTLPNYGCIPRGGCAQTCVAGQVAYFCTNSGER